MPFLSSASLVRPSVTSPVLAWCLLGAGIAVTLAANVTYGVVFGLAGALWAAWPAVAFVGCYELLMLLIRASAGRQQPQADPGTVSSWVASDAETARIQSPVQWICPRCGKSRGLTHTCRIKTDFKKRKRAAARKAATAERRLKRQAVRARQAARRRQAAAERRARTRASKQLTTRTSGPSRPRGDSHEPGTCGDRDCPRYGCKSYFQGMEDCPLEHAG